jgi:hypothetical protein
MNKVININDMKKKKILQKHAYEFASAASNKSVQDLTEEEKLEVAGTYELQMQITNAMNDYVSVYSASEENLLIMTRVISHIMNDVIKIAKESHGREFAEYLRLVLNEDSES